MKPIDYVYIAILVVSLILSAFYSCTDMAYSSVNKLRLERKALCGDKKAESVLRYATDYDSTIATILFGNDFVNILASSVASLLGRDLLMQSLGEAEASSISSLILVVVLLLIGEIIPKAIAKSHPFTTSKVFLPLIKVSSFIFYPFTKPVNFLAKRMASPFLEKSGPETSLASDDELDAMVDDIKNEGLIDKDQSELLHKSIDFKETSCYDVMTPRVKVFAYDIESSFEEFLKKKDVFVHSRIPVYKGDLDHVLGYIQAKTLLRVLVKGEKPDIDSLILPIISVPRTMEISSAMALFKETNHHIAIVRDEFGGTEGLLTLEDILEELVGEMWDESDKVTVDIAPTKKRNVFIVKGSTNIEDFMEKFRLDPDAVDEDYSTVSGWIIDRLGRFAKKGDKLSYKKIDVKVTKILDFSIAECEVVFHPRRKK